MSSFISALLFAIVIIEVVLFLLPTTLLYVFGVFVLIVIAAEMLLTTSAGLIIQLSLMTFPLLLLLGYGLYSLWWLVICHRKHMLNEVPMFIFGGLVVGGLLAFFIDFKIISFGLGARFSFFYEKDMMFSIVAGVGPLLLTFTLLIIMLPWKRLLRKH